MRPRPRASSHNGVDGTTLNASDPYSARDGVSTIFPSFVPAAGLGYLAFAGDMTGSGFKHGRHHVMEDPKTPLCNLWLSQLKGTGINVESHGDSTGIIDSLFV